MENRFQFLEAQGRHSASLEARPGESMLCLGVNGGEVFLFGGIGGCILQESKVAVASDTSLARTSIVA